MDPSLQQGLHQDGRRMTPQRQRVLDLFRERGSGCHLSAEEVHQQLSQQKLKVFPGHGVQNPAIARRHGVPPGAGADRKRPSL